MILFEKNFRALGTDIELKLVLSNEEEKQKTENDFKKLVQEYSRLEKIFSRFDPDSELSSINNDTGRFHEASPEMIEVAESCLKYNKNSQGLFDPRVIGVLEKSGYGVDFFSDEFPRLEEKYPVDIISGELKEYITIEGNKLKFGMRMDFSGIAKGYITDRATRLLRELGWNNFLIDSGGDMYLAGRDVNENKWTIELEGFPEGKIVLNLSNQAIATSGISRRQWMIGEKRYHHLINPLSSEEYAFDLKSATAIAASVEEADFWAKYLFLSGKEKGMAICRNRNVAGLFLSYQGPLFISDKVKNYFTKE